MFFRASGFNWRTPRLSIIRRSVLRFVVIGYFLLENGSRLRSGCLENTINKNSTCCKKLVPLVLGHGSSVIYASFGQHMQVPPIGEGTCTDKGL